MFRKNKESKIMFTLITIMFIGFLAVPTIMLLMKSFEGDGGVSLSNYKEILSSEVFLNSLKNSFIVSSCSAVITTLIAFLLAYTINFTNISEKLKKFITFVVTLPMLLPTITYGFAIIYSFGKQGLITNILGFQPFEIYGFYGLLIGYCIYTIPITFLLVNNTFKYIDKRYLIVSKVMGDSPLSTFYITTLRPLMGTLVGAFIQAFFLSFTDFGIPASVGGKFDVVATTLYNQMLGSVPNFNNGAVIAMVMLIPSVVGIFLLNYLEKYNFRYNKVSTIELKKNKVRDFILGGISTIFILSLLSIFMVIFIVPFVKNWPYDMSFTMDHIKNIIVSSNLDSIYINSLFVAIITAIFGSLISYGAALVTCRSNINKKCKSVIESIALITNTIPGMVLGIAFLLTFSKSSIHNTFLILIICNIVHFFSTPYLMMKNSLSKLNNSFETTAMLLGDSFIKTIVRIITPNIKSTIIEVFSYYFIHSMVTISALIFLTGAKTMVITTKIKELQHLAKFDEIFVLSLLIFATNITAKIVFGMLAKEKTKSSDLNSETSKNKVSYKFRPLAKVALGMCAVLAITGFIGSSQASNSKDDKVIIYSNADDEAIEAMKKALDNNGYKDEYIMQSFGTSELGGKLLAEGKNIEADLVTMSSYYIDSSQKKNDMFKNLDFETNAIENYPRYYTPITLQEGAIIVNTEVLKEHNLEAPTSIKDLADEKYKDLISIPDISGSSTGWLLVQAVLKHYGEIDGKEVMEDIIENVGPHLESSGSAPIKKVRAGEVGIAFGLRHQAVRDKEEGMPIDFVDPIEGNFSLTESIAVINKDKDTNPLAIKMAECIIKNARVDLIKSYPNPVYKDETVDEEKASKYPMKYGKTLTVDLLEQHKEFSESCK